MSILYGRFFVFEANSLSEGLQRIAQTHAVRGTRFEFLSSWWRLALRRGYGWPFFEDGGALVEIRPSLNLLIQLSKDESIGFGS